MQVTTVRSRLQSGQPAIGTWLALDSVLGAEWIAHQGFDWLAIEQRRGPFDPVRTLSLLRAIGATNTLPLIRVPWKDPRTVAQALDAGAAGVFIPSIETRVEAERCVAAARASVPGRCASEAARPLVAVTIETAPGLQNVDDIVRVGGIDACFVRPAELCASLGFEQYQEPTDGRYFEALARVYAACRAYGVAPGLQVRTTDRAIRHIAEGWQLVGIGSDGELMARAAANTVAAIRDRLRPVPER